MADVKIIFKTEAELAGAVAVQQSLERQIGKAKALGENTAELDKQLAKVNSTLIQHHQAVVKNAEAYADLKSSAQSLAGDIPVIGSALTQLSNPILAATALATAAVAAFSNWSNAMAAAGLAQQAFAPGSNSLSTAARSMQDMVDRAADFNEALRLQETNFARVEAASNRAISGINQNTAAQKQALDAEKVLAEARLELRRQTDPNFSQQDFNAARRGLRADFRQRGRALEVKELEDTLAVQVAEKDELRKRAGDAQVQKPEQEAALQAALDKQKALAITSAKDRAALETEKATNEKKIALIDYSLSGGTVGGAAVERFGLQRRDVEGMTLGSESKANLDARNRQIQTQLTDKLTAEQQANERDIRIARSKLADTNADIAKREPGGAEDQKQAQIGQTRAQLTRVTGTLATSQTNLDTAGDVRESAATASEIRGNIRTADKQASDLMKQIGKALADGNSELAQVLRDTLSVVVQQVANLNRQVAAIKAQAEAAYNHRN